ncbi:DNA primase [Gordonibacter massiliensis (ex Traore et al. 2017)]|uniref:DNA primase n=1 Tax=Gordonibacter massiliensis (ex Traore et al. 2017) TaxID=1841863 RepID=A0A842JJ39_9ACTN|nr:DNA primase [Gordonibacter massiliensis (ex Traore et al. 2017)]MBC2889249.1 DNA primase [Gordonibacter massiliensis (ex Traore et al. 2017)]
MAGTIGEEDIQKVREASDLVAIIGERSPVKQRGRDFWCCCPLHHEKTPSFKIDPVLQLWHCFGCGEGGDVFGFLMKTEDLSFPEAVRKLAERAHIDIAETGGRPGVANSKKARLKAVCEATAAFYHIQLMRNPEPDAAAARSYLAGRGLGGDVPKRWQLGFAPGHGKLVRHLTAQGFNAEEMVEANVAMKDRGGKLRDRFFNRVIFPINDAQGECIAFGGRVIGKGEPKYLNSQETPVFHKSQVLYGLDHAKAAMAATGVAVVVEGYTDVIALHEAGIANAVATLGTALTLRHIRLLSRHAQHKIVYLFDGDEAGQRAADRALGFIDDSMTPEAGRAKVELAAVTLPDNLDPAEFVGARGADALRALIADARPLLKYGIERRLAAHDLTSAEGRSRALVDALSVLAPIKDSLLAKDYAVQIASRCRAREEDVLDQLARLEPPRRTGEADAGEEPRRAAATPPAAEGAGVAGDAGRAARRSGLSQPELNRRRFEREFLSLAAQHPDLALVHADALAQTQWHEPAHAALAQSMLATLAEDPAAPAARVVSDAARTLPQAPNILTSGSMAGSADPREVARFLVEELGIGDAEDAVAALRAQLSDPSLLPADEYEMLFQSVTAMQKDLTRRRLAHKPFVSE